MGKAPAEREDLLPQPLMISFYVVVPNAHDREDDEERHDQAVIHP
jgi:hypothetical protein